MFLRGDAVVTSASDLSAASKCEFAYARMLDAKLGRVEALETAPDAMLERAARLGDVHEARTLQSYRQSYGAGVVEIERPSVAEAGALEAAAQTTVEAFAGGAAVVFQATFFDGGFLGFADFIVRTASGAYEVQDTKLARSAKITALLQLAAYAEQLQRLGIPTADRVVLILGDGRRSEHRLRDIAPVYRKRKARLDQLIAGRLRDPAPVEWGDPRYAACGRCDICQQQVEEHRDVLLVAGLTVTQRARLRSAGISTIDELAASTGRLDDIAERTMTTLTLQARLQLAPTDPEHPLAWHLTNISALAALPPSDVGDIFFDFEGDPLHQEGNVWGLDYLFGVVESDESFRAFWAHDLAAERQALIEFLDYVGARRAAHPHLHIYHYAAYERTHLLMLAARHGVGEEFVDDLLRNNVLVDLYPIVRRGFRIGTRSYSLKKLEPLYMEEAARTGVSTAGDSIAEYVHARELLDSGDAAAGQAALADIAQYNAYDCLSTLKLRNWLADRATELAGGLPGSTQPPLPVALREPDPVYLELSEYLEHVPLAKRDADQTALALAAAAIDYHRREAKSFWWEHYSRLVEPIDEWPDTRGVFVIDNAILERNWQVMGNDRSLSRVLALEGIAGPGTSANLDGAYVVYDPPYPPIEESTEPGARFSHRRSHVELGADGRYRLTEKAKPGAPTYDAMPVALTPAAPPQAGSNVTAISEWGRAVLDAAPALLENAALDILRRRPPRTPRIVPVMGEPADAIRQTLLTLDHSYLAVQGPPGSGKTSVGSEVIARLVEEHGWRVGVVAQSHTAIENMLAAIVKAGLDPQRVGKKPKSGSPASAAPWTVLGDKTEAAFLAQSGGYVIGGTSWTFSNALHVARGSLDLLVVDEAGQYSLASTIAASVAAQRLLLLGDPQQLPQVSQGTHPEPVDVSALGWLSEGHDVLPAEFGYFLATSWRMHPAVCGPISALSYEGRLHSSAPERSLHGIAAGVHPHPIVHEHDSTASADEAAAVVQLVREVVGRPWTANWVTRPLGEADVIVVAPYNAQVELIRDQLDAASLAEVPVGTVDKFQGREAVVSIVSLAASSGADAPRGIDFLLLENRLNVALSRAQWAAYLVFSPDLAEGLPTSVDGVARLSAFIHLVEPPGCPVDASTEGAGGQAQPAAATSSSSIRSIAPSITERCPSPNS